MNTLVTGGAGFIGSHIVDFLVEKNHNVTILDNLSTGFKENINKNAKFIKGDVRDYEVLKKASRNKDYIFHLAAQTSVPESVKFPEKCFDININGMINIIKASSKNNIKKIIFSSSAAVYGNTPIFPNKEKHFTIPNNPYGITKLASEHLLETYSQENGLRYNALRFMNVYGPRQNPNSEYAAVIPIFIKRALKNQNLIIYGDGKQTRDFIYIKDVVNATIKSINKGQGVYNIGTAKKTSINELAKIIIKDINPKLKIKYSKERSEGIRDSVSDISKAVKGLKWKPLVNLNQALKETIRYTKK